MVPGFSPEGTPPPPHLPKYFVNPHEIEKGPQRHLDPPMLLNKSFIRFHLNSTQETVSL